ncbi:hypothetical protein J1614_010956 [Plenodomus biglobosus]|nr:hypothetical protein J1614_010956 [Plenodomus biglobosus]
MLALKGPMFAMPALAPWEHLAWRLQQQLPVFSLSSLEGLCGLPAGWTQKGIVRSRPSSPNTNNTTLSEGLIFEEHILLDLLINWMRLLHLMSLPSSSGRQNHQQDCRRCCSLRADSWAITSIADSSMSQSTASAPHTIRPSLFRIIKACAATASPAGSLLALAASIILLAFVGEAIPRLHAGYDFAQRQASPRLPPMQHRFNNTQGCRRPRLLFYNRRTRHAAPTQAFGLFLCASMSGRGTRHCDQLQRELYTLHSQNGKKRMLKELNASNNIMGISRLWDEAYGYAQASGYFRLLGSSSQSPSIISALDQGASYLQRLASCGFRPALGQLHCSGQDRGKVDWA